MFYLLKSTWRDYFLALWEVAGCGRKIDETSYVLRSHEASREIWKETTKITARSLKKSHLFKHGMEFHKHWDLHNYLYDSSFMSSQY